MHELTGLDAENAHLFLDHNYKIKNLRELQHEINELRLKIEGLEVFKSHLSKVWGRLAQTLVSCRKFPVFGNWSSYYCQNKSCCDWDLINSLLNGLAPVELSILRKVYEQIAALPPILPEN